MSRYFLLPLLLVLFLCTSVRAQNVRLLARPYGDSVTLRWAPTDFASWSELRRHGVVVERRRIGGEKTFAAVPGERRIALPLADIKSFADTNDVHVVAVAEALYGEATPGTKEGPLGRAKDVNEEQRQRLFLALINADLSAKAAEVLGWRYVDRDVRPGYTYDYRLRLLGPEPRYGDTLRVRSDGHFYAGPVVKLRGEAGNGKVQLIWPRAINERSFTAYRLEFSSDGASWRDLLDLPLLPDPAGELEFSYTIEDPPAGVARHYRLRGINPFGELGPPSEGIVLTPRDATPPPAPFSVNGADLRDGRNRLRWTVPDELPPDLAGYRVLRGLHVHGPFAPAHAGLLPAGETVWIDSDPYPGRNNYYAVEAVDESGNAARSPVNFVQRWDDTPPAQPLGLTGRIDTLGRVFLLWEAGREPDLLGYRVYRSHARDREFLQVTNEVQHRNFFFDSTSLLVLNETVLYKIVAVDNHYNPSEYSATLELKRPDKVAPAAPSISGYSVMDEGVRLRIRPSNSDDVVRQTIWRAGAGESPRPLAATGPLDTVFVDTTVAVRTSYTYTVRAEDEVGLFGTSSPLRVRTGAPVSGAGVVALARSRVPGTNQEALLWDPPAAAVTGYQLYAGPTPQSLRPLRRFGPDAREWPLRDETAHYALRVLYADGRKSPLSNIVGPPKN